MASRWAVQWVCLQQLETLQALWNRELDTYLRSLGFTPSISDPCLYKLCNTDYTDFEKEPSPFKGCRGPLDALAKSL